jgi:hypothetical protein
VVAEHPLPAAPEERKTVTEILTGCIDMSSDITWADLPTILHDARLLELRWVTGWLRRSQVRLRFECLRRNTDGSALADRKVELVIHDLATLAVAYDAACRPSEFHPCHVLSAGDLHRWPSGAEPAVWVNDPGRDGDFLGALRVDWFAGGPAALPGCPVRVGLAFGYGLPGLQILVGGAGIEAFAAGRPLELAEWAAQYGAWWDGWHRHWAEKENNPAAPGSLPEDTTIPAGIEPPLDPGYPWPDEPVVDWDPTDAPAEMLAALAEWFEAEARQEGSPGGGRRFYARQVDVWWVEGNRAAASVRGVEHSTPAGEFPASNTESVQQFSLRRRGTGWAVRPLARGWPPYGSAPARPAADKPWLLRWRSGPVVTERPVG